MRRLLTTALLLLALAGCGGQDSENPPKTTTGQTLKQRGDRLAATMRQLAHALDRLDCYQAGRLRDRMVAQSRALTPYRDESGVAAAQVEVRGLASEVDGLCR
jgi:hypothetical protein